MLQLCSMKKIMTKAQPFLLPLQFLLSLILLMTCLQEVVNNQNVVLRELSKSLAAVAMLGMLAAASNNSIHKNNDTHENH